MPLDLNQKINRNDAAKALGCSPSMVSKLGLGDLTLGKLFRHLRDRVAAAENGDRQRKQRAEADVAEGRARRARGDVVDVELAVATVRALQMELHADVQGQGTAFYWIIRDKLPPDWRDDRKRWLPILDSLRDQLRVACDMSNTSLIRELDDKRRKHRYGDAAFLERLADAIERDRVLSGWRPERRRPAKSPAQPAGAP